jgi:hypothetical protein
MAAKLLPSSNTSHRFMEIVMNIGGAASNSSTEASRGHSVNTMPLPSVKEAPVGFYDHLLMYMAPHVSDNRQDCIAKAAYFLAEQRGFAPGHELDDWLAAESEFDQRLAGEGCVY